MKTTCFGLARFYRTCALLLLVAPAGVEARGETVTLFFERDHPLIEFAVAELERSLEERGHQPVRADLEEFGAGDVPIRIVLCEASQACMGRLIQEEAGLAGQELREEGYAIRTIVSVRRQESFWVIGADGAGAMYGGLEAAEVIRLEGLRALRNVVHNPYMRMRGTKFNCPLDVRTPSYSDTSDAAQRNIAEMWNFEFWKEYIDNLARHRYNYISLWNLHPFPSLVRVPDYPEVALDDVKRSTVRWKEDYALEGTEFDAPEILGRTETIRKLTIDEKIAFWRRVMRHGKERNVDFYFVTWNIFVNGTEGKYGITDEIDNPVTVDYFRKSVDQMFLTYPDLAGIGLTTGENMPGASFEAKEKWAFETYGRGVLDAAEKHPGRKITLIHRQHQTGAQAIAQTFSPLFEQENVDFIFSFKYAQAHALSSTEQTFHHEFVEDLKAGGGLETIWTLRNDDNYFFRWGAPDFVRGFIRKIPYEVSRGFYYGSDQYIWGREFLSRVPEASGQLEIAKHWYHWMLWGRLGYDPGLGNQRLIAMLRHRFPEVPGDGLFEAWQEASMVYPVTTGFHWGALDFQWYIEACKSRPGPARTPSGFHDVNRFISLAPHKGTDYLSIPDFVRATAEQRAPEGTTPVEVAETLRRQADRSLTLLEGFKPVEDLETRLLLEDIRAMAYLGKYYGHKIRGATELALFRETGGPAHHESAIEELNRAAGYWRLYASTALSQYRNPLWTNRVGYVDFRELFGQVIYDVRSAGGEPQLASMEPTAGGVVLEAEEARWEGAGRRDGTAGFTGSSYLEFSHSTTPGWVEWTFEAPRSGTYWLEIRYAADTEKPVATELLLNGTVREPFSFWTTGGMPVWGWDRVPVTLRGGKNRIRLSAGRRIRVDHLNVLGGFYSD